MKIYFFVFALLLIPNLKSSAQTEAEALEYLHNLTQPLENFRTETWNVIKTTMSSRSSSMLDKRIKGLVSKIETTEATVTKEEGFYGDLSIKVAMKIFLRNARTILNEDYQKIKNLKVTSQHSFKNMEAYLMAQVKANERLSESGKRLDDEIIKFAERYGVTVSNERSETSKKIVKASEAMNYYNQTYLSFFKVHEQRLKVYGALSQENLEEIKKENLLLAEFCDLSLERLDIQDAFFGDDKLWNAANNIIKHIKTEAEEIYPNAIRAIEKKQIYEMAQKVYQKIPQEDRTQNDVDHVNALIEPLNAAVEIQNSTFNQASMDREVLFRSWNDELRTFCARYLN